MIAHLNGGPRDDEIMAVTYDVLFVRVMRWTYALPLPASCASCLTTQVGTYGQRLDAFGQPVPHSLAGESEFDWQGWGAEEPVSHDLDGEAAP